MKIETEVLTIPGLDRTYTFYHTSDCHLACAEPHEGPEAVLKAEKQTKAWSYTGVLPADAFDQVLQMVKAEQADGLFLCGDAADYLSEGTLQAVRQRLQNAGVPVYYVCGNHERSGVEPENSREFYPAYQDLMHGSPGFWRCDLGPFVIVGLDDGDKQMRSEQLEQLEAECAKGKPMLVLIHIPILTEAIMGPVRQKWGENGPDYFLLGQDSDTELSRRFCRMLADPAAPIRAVFAGHIHLSLAGEIIAGRMQYTSGPVFEGVIRKYVLKPE